jgi:hypothetical protein
MSNRRTPKDECSGTTHSLCVADRDGLFGELAKLADEEGEINLSPPPPLANEKGVLGVFGVVGESEASVTGDTAVSNETILLVPSDKDRNSAR